MPLTDLEIKALQALLAKLSTLKGDIGNTGAQGIPGATGETGKQGEPGKNCVDPIPEPWSTKKFVTGMTKIIDPVSWAKDIYSILNIRKLLIYTIIIGAFFGYGYFKGIGNKPVHVELEGKEAVVALGNNLFLHILPDGTLHTQDAKGVTINLIKVKDIPALQKALKPIGLDVKPIFVAGTSLGASKTKGVEVGVGASIFKVWRVHLDAWLTQAGVYLGADYGITQNFGIIGGVGQGYSAGDKRVFLGGVFRF